MTTRKGFVAFLIVAIGAFAGCGGGSSTPVTVAISANANSVATFQTVQFSATVTGTSNQAVTWGLTCNATATTSVCGSISASGVYTAPNTVPTVATSQSTDPAVVTITATSQAKSSAFSSVQFNVNSLNQQSLTAPVQLGSSGGNADSLCANTNTCTGGTLGSLVTGGGKFYVLSNNHVLGLSDGATVGQEVTQPGIIDTNCQLAGTINVATVADIISLESQPTSTPVDVTTALVTSGQVDTFDHILELGAVSSGVPQPAQPVEGGGMAATVGELLAKSGRTTGLTCATVDTINTTMVVVQYTKGCTTTNFNVTYNDEVVVNNMSSGQNFIGNGDSGSLAVDEATAQPVALMFAGDETSALGNPVADVLAALQATNGGTTFTFVGTAAPHAVPGCSLPGLSAVAVTPQEASKTSSSAAQNAMATANRNAAQIINTQGVSAYGAAMSLDAPKEPAILIFASTGASHADIPAEIDGVRTRIIETNDPSVRGAINTQQSAQLASQSAQAQAAQLSASAVQTATTVKEQHAAELMSDPAVQGVGVGASLDSPGEAAVVIYVMKNKVHRPIPATIDGVRTRIKETTGFHAITGPSSRSAGCSPVKTSHAAATAAPPEPAIRPVASH
jgi:hypothetical protein